MISKIETCVWMILIYTFFSHIVAWPAVVLGQEHATHNGEYSSCVLKPICDPPPPDEA